MVENEESNGNGYLSQKPMDKENKKKTSDKLSKPLNVEIMENAAKIIFRMIQRKLFPEDVKALNSGTHNTNGVNRSSSFFKLGLLLKNNGVLQVGGRLGDLN